MVMEKVTDSAESLSDNKGKMSMASGSSQSSSSSSSIETKFLRLNLKLKSTLRKSWSFRKMEEYAKRGRSQSDLGFYDTSDDQKPKIPSENIARILAANALRLARPAANINENIWPQGPLVVEDPPTDSDVSSDDADDQDHNLLIGAVMICFVQGFEANTGNHPQEQANIEDDPTNESNNNELSVVEKTLDDDSKISTSFARRSFLYPFTYDSKSVSKKRDTELVKDGNLPEDSGGDGNPKLVVKRTSSDKPTVLQRAFVQSLIRRTRSTSNCPATAVGGGAGAGARSAPATPLQPPTPTPLTLQRTPEHRDKNGKQASWSASEGGGGSPPPPPSGSKARQKKFHRHFPQAAQEERVLNYYSCALVGDILLQGHLYITKNYFAFYSNVFGYVTKLLIPLASVNRVTKEKMARIIPNAVGVATQEDKHVFASLLSRDTTYKLMIEVWKAAHVPITEVVPIPKELRQSKTDVEASEVSVDDESSVCSQSGGEDAPTVAEVACLPMPEVKLPFEEVLRIRAPKINDLESLPNSISENSLTPRSRRPISPASNVMGRRKVRPPKAETSCQITIIFAVIFSVLLIVSALLLYYRLEKKAASDTLEENLLLLKRGDDVYSEILKWHSQLHSKSAMQVHEFLHSNLDQISKVRQSLETLSTLIGGIITDKMKSPMDSNKGFITTGAEGEAASRDNRGSGRPPSKGNS